MFALLGVEEEEQSDADEGTSEKTGPSKKTQKKNAYRARKREKKKADAAQTAAASTAVVTVASSATVKQLQSSSAKIGAGGAGFSPSRASTWPEWPENARAGRSEPVASPARLAQTESWTAARFLGSLKFIPELLAAQLVEDGCTNELGALQSLARSRDLEDQLRRRMTSGVEAFIDRLSSKLKGLASDAAPTAGLMAYSDLDAAQTAKQLQDKFMQDGAGLMAYSDLNTFFGGLEKMVGAPLPCVAKAMAAEHTEKPDSHLEFTTLNFGVTTTSATEWAFVAEPETRDWWPVEKKHVQERRRPMPIAELKRLVDERGVRLCDQGEPALTLEEAFGARLYTGPLYEKYNAVLRGLCDARLESPDLKLRCKMVQLCCSAKDAALHAQAADELRLRQAAAAASHAAAAGPSSSGNVPALHERKPTAADEKALHEYTHAYEKALRRINKYPTTLHAINSAIVKLSKLTKPSTVYRGIYDHVLPDQFWTPNKDGVNGGIDGAFQSASLEREQAIKYATSGSKASLLFEIQQGMIDRGADFSFLSQYTFEKEIVFNPLTGLEVCGRRVEGSVLIIEVRLSVNLTSLTIEQVIGKRKKMLQDMVFGLEAEVRQALHTEGLATPYGTEKVLGWFHKDVEKHVLDPPRGHPPERYNSDEQLVDALQEMLQAKQQYGRGLQRRAQALGALTQEEVLLCGFEPKAYTKWIVGAVTKLEKKDARERMAALKILGKLKPATLLAQHGAALVAVLEDSYADADVRTAVVETLGKLEPATLSQHSAALVARLEDSRYVVRRAVVETLGKLEPATLSQHSAALVAKLEDLVAKLEDRKGEVRETVVAMLNKLEPAILLQHRDALVARSKHADRGVSKKASIVLKLMHTRLMDERASSVQFSEPIMPRRRGTERREGFRAEGVSPFVPSRAHSAR